MKKGWRIVGVIAGMALVGGLIAFLMTRDMPKAAHAFFTLIAQQRYDEAYRSTAAAFQEATDEAGFTAFISRTLLTEYAAASWSSRSVENRHGQLDGTVRTKDGARIPVTLEFVKEADAWKVLSMKMGDAGFVRTDGVVPVPPGDELIRLTNDAIQELGVAINTRDFDAFYAGISRMWRKQTSPLELHQAFTLFTISNIDLLTALEVNPLFSEPPAVDPSGVLALEGYYPLEPKALNFHLQFINEAAEWKLLGINVRL